VNNGKKIYELTKQYSQTGFPDENSIGYAIDVYQESINKTFREYLVNYPLLVRMMEKRVYPYNRRGGGSDGYA
jgi:hypothetical protein